MSNVHVPVLLKEVIEAVPSSAVTAFDGTLGGGGHTQAFLEKGLTVTSSDLDSNAITLAQATIPETLQKNWKPIHASFAEALKTLENNSQDVILLDLGFSSNQLENSGRGFSYLKHNDPLDLRYDVTKGQPAFFKIRHTAEKDLGDILYRYSGEKFARVIAKAISYTKKDKGDLTVGDIVLAITPVIPPQFARKLNAILSRVWQALRIWTNAEFEVLTEFLKIAPDKLSTGGVLMIISFHSLEDKLVTKTFRTLSRPQVIDNFGNTQKSFDLLTKSAIEPTVEEITENPRSRSALLRILKKL